MMLKPALRPPLRAPMRGATTLREGGGVPWTPAALGASLLAWWTADRADLITLSGNLVTSWKDAVAAYDMVQAVGGSRPVYSATGFNGFPCVTADGGDDELTLASVPWPNGAAASEIWALVQQNAAAADTSSRTVASYGGASTAAGRGLRRIVTTGVNRGALGVGDGGSLVTASETTIDLSGRRVMRGEIGATSSIASVDSVASAGAAVVPATGTSRTRLFASNAATASLFWNGLARDILITAALTAGQATLLYNYLNSRRAP